MSPDQKSESHSSHASSSSPLSPPSTSPMRKISHSGLSSVIFAKLLLHVAFSTLNRVTPWTWCQLQHSVMPGTNHRRRNCQIKPSPCVIFCAGWSCLPTPARSAGLFGRRETQNWSLKGLRDERAAYQKV